MKQGILAAILIFSTPFSLPLLAQSKPTLLQGRGVAPNAASFYAVWANSGEIVESYQPDLPLAPASSAKLITTYCAMKELGGNFRFQTRFYSEAPPKKGIIQNLWVKGEGDPSMVSETLWFAVRQLRAYGIQNITGNIIIDTSYFDKNSYPGRQENNRRAYNAPTSAVSLNFNSVAVQIRPNGRKAHVTLFPDIPYFQLANHLKSGGKRNIYLGNTPTDSGERISVGGSFPSKGRPETIYRSVLNPSLFFGHTLATLLKESGVSFKGKILEESAEGKHLLYSHPSKPLSQMIGSINKFSNNFMAEQVTKYLGAKEYGPPGSTLKGVNALNKCLVDIGVNVSNLQFENGSGLSYHNRLTARALVKVLLAGYRDFRMRPDFLASLSVHGIDGTMEHRSFQNKLEGLLRAKTGTLTGISALAGFIPAKNGELIAFAIMMNNLGGGVADWHQAQDAQVYEWSQLTK